MYVPQCAFAAFLTFVLIIISRGMPSQEDDEANVDIDYVNDQPYNPNWIKDYDPFEKPPCPNWNPYDGCGRTPARTKPPATTPGTSERTTPLPEVHTTRITIGSKLVCTLDEVKTAACLNGGDCFALYIQDHRSAHCKCSEMWTGTRCEQIDEDIFGLVLSADKVEKAGIAAGVVGLIIILTVVIVYLVVKRRKRRKDRAEANGNANGHAGKALMGSEKEATDSDDAEKCTDV